MPPSNRARWAVTAAVLVALTGCTGSDGDTPVAATAATSAAETTLQALAADADGGADADDATQADAESSTTSPTEPEDVDDEVVSYVLKVFATHPHDTGAYTQGLEVVDDLLLESTGLRGESSIRLVEPETGEVVQSAPLDAELFGEGATIVGDEVWQLTWTSESLLIHRLDDLSEQRQLSYQGQGWGLCAMGEQLIMSDGSSLLTIRESERFAVVDQVQVIDETGPVGALNELECVDGLVWANVYQTTLLVAIDPVSGRVVGRADMADLVPDGFEGDGTNVANGIAHDPDTGRFYLTGKRWPVLYEVEFVPLP